MTDTREKLQRVFQDVFDDEEIQLRDDMNADDVEDWDSLQHINLIVAVEKALGIRFATAEIGRLKEPGQDVGTFLSLIEEKLSGSEGI